MDGTLFDNFIANQTEMLTAVMQKIDNNGNGLIFIVNEREELCGVVSDGDIRRWILKGGSIETQVKTFMNTTPVYVMSHDSTRAGYYMDKEKIRVVPVLDEKKHIVDIIMADRSKYLEKAKKMFISGVNVVIMAGGKGTRLYPYTKILPKPLIPIGEIPIVERVINAFAEYGISNFLMTVNYKKNMIKSYFSEIEKNYTIEYVEEEKPLGTAGSIKLIDKPMREPLFVANCDSLVRTDYIKLYQYHTDMRNAITIVTALKNDTIPYGVVYSKADGILERMDEKPLRSYFINTGMYVINPQMIDLIPEDSLFHMTQLVEKAVECGHRVGVYPVSEDSFLDMGEFAEMRRMEEKLNIHMESREQQ